MNCIIARSNEAKALGIPMGAPLYEWKDIIKHHNVRVYSANFALYGDMSARVMQILTEYASEIEYYSIDEAFLHVSNHSIGPAGTLMMMRNENKITDIAHAYTSRYYYTSYGHHLKNIIKMRTGIPVSIGIGPTKTLAKVAVEFAKKNVVYDGVFDISERSDKDQLLQAVDVKDVWGIAGKIIRNYGQKGFIPHLILHAWMMRG